MLCSIGNWSCGFFNQALIIMKKHLFWVLFVPSIANKVWILYNSNKKNFDFSCPSKES